jgi:UDP-N-acetylmuramyl pentapeptide phosphotransferase/UDP-N-acetylglucosamine-1-phosphate transferase
MMSWLMAIVFLTGSAAVTIVLIQLLRPLLTQYALARPNARSSHTAPTPQGAGLAVVGTTLVLVVAMWLQSGTRDSLAAPNIISFVLAILGLAAVGFIDDVTPLPAKLRLAVQAACCLGLLLALPDGARALPFIPYPLEADRPRVVREPHQLHGRHRRHNGRWHCASCCGHCSVRG